MRIVDCARWQVERPDPLDLAKAQAAGINAVNIALDRGRSTDVLSDWARTYADKARGLGMGISAYRWVDNRQSGAEHARRALARMKLLGGPDGMAHGVDCEDNADLDTLADYVTAMQQARGRPIAVYSGRWWLRPRGWNVAALSPFLWAAPSVGYLTDYPGDDSPHWQVDYGGHSALALMQYAVKPLPGTGDCSLTAVRDPAVWAALTGIPLTPEDPMATAAYYAWVAADRPNYGPIRPLKALRDLLRRYGYTVYDVGNLAHLTHDPPEDHTPFSGTGWPGTSTRWWIHALDIMPPPAGSGLPSLQQISAQMLADKRGGHPGMAWLKYMNYEPERDNGGACYQLRFMPNEERRTSTDRGHIHASARTDMVTYAGADTYDPVARIRGNPTTLEGADMPLTDADVMKIWTWDLVNGPNVGLAYELVNRLVADVAELKARPVVDVAALANNPAFVNTLATAIAAQVNQQTGATADQVRTIVDEELDEAFRGGADKDT